LLVAANAGKDADLRLLLRCSAAVGVLSLALAASNRFLARLIGNADRARLGVGAALALAATAPLWSGPVAERLGDRAVNAAVAVSPLSYLAEMVQYDYLRSQWFYVHSPLGSLRFAPPGSWIASGSYLALGLVLLAGEQALSKRRR
jgi:hypothetical protein